MCAFSHTPRDLCHRDNCLNLPLHCNCTKKTPNRNKPNKQKTPNVTPLFRSYEQSPYLNFGFSQIGEISRQLVNACRLGTFCKYIGICKYSLVLSTTIMITLGLCSLGREQSIEKRCVAYFLSCMPYRSWSQVLWQYL